ncbi:MAG TPA: aldehyde ferredoxin oxidoreductase N-terminal domain-containing protein, partial [Vicinamibacterales bacterium]|nr:aldehyde ferredoxin oxidoreductase N-terminal domain-containing protein [Vicinamibacterales bacterium]
MPFGYHGCYLRIDACRGTAERVAIDETVLRHFIGGSGLGVRLLLDEGCAGLDALDPRAPLIFSFSPLVGSPLTTSAKFAVVSKSPLTHRINDSLASSGFAIAGKSCGCDAIVIIGRAPEWSVLVIEDGRVRIESAAECARMTCQATDAHLRARLGANFRVATIGPAGEKGVRYATISHDGRHAGRGGSGAVLAAKNIKAIAVTGTHRSEWAHPHDVIAISKDLSRRSFGPATAKYRELGTAANLLTFNRFGALPTRNFQSGAFDEAENLSSEELAGTRTKTRESCVTCTIGCEHLYETSVGQVRVEYESLFALGSLCGVGDSETVLRASQRCDELGLDTISTGGTIAFAMECVERGWLDAPWLTFGSGDA